MRLTVLCCFFSRFIWLSILQLPLLFCDNFFFFVPWFVNFSSWISFFRKSLKCNIYCILFLFANKFFFSYLCPYSFSVSNVYCDFVIHCCQNKIYIKLQFHFHVPMGIERKNEINETITLVFNETKWIYVVWIWKANRYTTHYNIISNHYLHSFNYDYEI